MRGTTYAPATFSTSSPIAPVIDPGRRLRHRGLGRLGRIHDVHSHSVVLTVRLSANTNGATSAGSAANPAVTKLPSASRTPLPASQPRPTSRARVTRDGTPHATSYALATDTAKLLPTQISPTTPTTLATFALCCAVFTASITVLAASPWSPSQLTMSSATWSLPVARMPTIATARTQSANNAKSP